MPLGSNSLQGYDRWSIIVNHRATFPTPILPFNKCDSDRDDHWKLKVVRFSQIHQTTATFINPLHSLGCCANSEIWNYMCHYFPAFMDLHGLKFLQFLYGALSHEIGAEVNSGSERAQKQSMSPQLHFSFSILFSFDGAFLFAKIMQKLAFVNRGISAESNLV